jgi:hypothetical protein
VKAGLHVMVMQSKVKPMFGAAKKTRAGLVIKMKNLLPPGRSRFL